MKKFNYKQFKIGDFVEVSKLVCRNGKEIGNIVKRGLPDGNRILESGEKTLVGVITGVKNMKLGITDWEEECGTYFCGTGAITVWRVRFALTGKEWCALPEDLEKCDAPKKFRVKFSSGYTESCLETLRKNVKDAPRDDKGRWV